ncbi:hypothetical protein HID58_021830, partial [Brassica napus]
KVAQRRSETTVNSGERESQKVARRRMSRIRNRRGKEKDGGAETTEAEDSRPVVEESDERLPEVKDNASLTTFMSSLSQVSPRRHWFISDQQYMDTK